MRILWVATKAPSPITDGGRAVMSATIEMLAAAAGARVTVVTPLPIDGPIDRPIDRSIDGNAEVNGSATIVRSIRERSTCLDWPNSIVRSLRSGLPTSIERHTHAPLAARVAALMREEPPFDVVHAEQLQALTIAEPARRAGIACVLRAQNVESEVWDTAAGEAPWWRAAPLRLEARRLRRFEAAAIASVDATIALSPDDAATLAALSPAASARITIVPPSIPSAWLRPASPMFGAASDGDPVFMWIGSAGWAPNDAAREWLLDDIWPAITARVPQASLHLFAAARGSMHGSNGRGSNARGSIVWRGAPRESVEAFLPHGILLIPMRAAAGVRMRVLEAWARGVPVIASPAAVAGLDTEDGRDVLIAADARAFAEAAARLVTEPPLRMRLAHAGRATLARRHDPGRLAAATLDVYRQAIAHRRARREEEAR
jgi:polysaccharide biosynthesis protein PslH